MHPWPQPIDPLHRLALSAAAAALPLAVVLLVMGVLRRPGYIAAISGLVCSLALACFLWGMPVNLALMSVGFGVVYALWPIMLKVVGCYFLFGP